MTITLPDNLVNKVSASQFGTIVLALCGIIANMPDSLSNQIPQLFPEKYRGYIAPVFYVAAYIVHNFGATAKAQAIKADPAQPLDGAVQTVITKA